MARKSANHSVSLSQALVGYELHARARQLSWRTIADYKNTFTKFADFLGEDLPVTAIDHHHITAFLASRTDLVSKKTIANYHSGLSALWRWLMEEKLVPVHIVREVARPKAEQRVIEPFSEEQIHALLRNLTTSLPYTRPGKAKSTHSIDPMLTARNRAMLLLMLDTGARASELCGIKISDIDPDRQMIKVFGKGSKERLLPFSSPTGKALWRYMTYRADDKVNQYVFVTEQGRQINASRLLKIVRGIGIRANVPNVHPHRFRHTFAIQFLRNGGDIFTLKHMLGHTTLDMVQRYLRIAQVDIEAAHAKASPVDNWRL
jgi:site-specific recombinase XerD